MLGILYLVISTIFGRLIRLLSGISAENIFASASATGKYPPTWTFHLPFDMIVGTTILTTLHYFLSYFYWVFLAGKAHPFLISNIVLAAALLPVLIFFNRVWFFSFFVRNDNPVSSNAFGGFFGVSVVLIGVFGAYLMFYSFFIREGILHSGFSVFSDFAPHTAVIHSFSRGFNFPSEYPHFAGDGINYHFFFFYLCANLQYLGLPLDWAVNIPSLLGLLSFTTLLGSFGVLLTGKRGIFFLAPLMLFFRSSNAIFPYLREVYANNEGNLSAMLSEMAKKSDAFIGNMTVHDTWGFWAMNVYANQRHLLWGFSVVLILVMMFYPAIDRTTKEIPQKVAPYRPSVDIRIPFRFLIRYLKKPGSWHISDYSRLILSTLLLVLLPYWHGSMFITAICVLFVMALFSTDRLTYLIAAAAGGMASLAWTRFFSGGAQNVANPKLMFGFLSPDVSVPGILNYIFQILGVAVILIVLIFLTEKARENRVIIAASLAPLLLAFTVSLTPDVGVNHKYILASYALINIFVAGFFIGLIVRVLKFFRRLAGVCRVIYTAHKKRRMTNKAGSMTGYLLFRGKERVSVATKVKALTGAVAGLLITAVAVVGLSFCLFSTGIMDLIVFHNRNQNHFRIDLNSPLIQWVEEKTDPKDVFLTDHYSMHEFFFSGRKILYGWPYYTWSAGYDTALRKQLVREMFHGFGGDKEHFLATARELHVRYAIIDNGLLRNTEYLVDTEFFREHFEEVLSLPDKGGIIIYRLYSD